MRQRSSATQLAKSPDSPQWAARKPGSCQEPVAQGLIGAPLVAHPLPLYAGAAE